MQVHFKMKNHQWNCAWVGKCVYSDDGDGLSLLEFDDDGDI